MPEEKSTKKKSRGTLKTFVFYLKARYASGVIVTVDYNLKRAQKRAFEEGITSQWQKDLFGLSSPESFTDYVVTPVKPGLVALHSYAE